jgi:hypothetical protein
MRQLAKIFYEGLKGIKEVHDAHRKSAAPMYSTGYLAFRPIVEEEVDFTSLFEWYIEYKCEVCHELVYESAPEYYDIVRDALKESGYLPA